MAEDGPRHAPRRARTQARRRRRAAVATFGALAALGAGLAAWLVPGGTGATAPKDPAAKAMAAKGTAQPAKVRKVRTFLGPDGVVSRATVDENRRKGTTAWKIAGAPKTGSIEGFADRTGAKAGQHVKLYVSTSAARFHVVAYRMGYYGGAGARAVWRSRQLAGHVQPPCPVHRPTNTVACDNWHASTTITITKAFVQGDYLLKLVGSGNEQSYVLLTVYDPASTAAYVLVARSMTEEGWNTYGGFDFYQGTGSCPPGSPTYPPCNRARVVSFDRPYAAGNGASDFMANEYPLVRFAERHGLDVAYVTDVTVSADPQLLLHHRAILSLAHDETWTWPELHGVEQALQSGVNVAFLSAAAIVRHARLQASPLGPDREVVDYRDPAEDPLDGKASPMEVTGNTWATPPTDVQASAITGELYSGFVEPGVAPLPFVVYDAGSWLFKGTGLHRGSTIDGVIASDIDHLDTALPTPGDIQVLGHSPVPLKVAYTNQGKWGADTYADMTYYTTAASKAGVFDSGTVNWIDALGTCSAASCPAHEVGKITGNLLHLLGQGPAGRTHPSVSNVASLSPSGS